jgi:hypothetical protein
MDGLTHISCPVRRRHPVDCCALDDGAGKIVACCIVRAATLRPDALVRAVDKGRTDDTDQGIVISYRSRETAIKSFAGAWTADSPALLWRTARPFRRLAGRVRRTRLDLPVELADA